jgi:CO/xanthine dehydrogenase FAD-binding subunit
LIALDAEVKVVSSGSVADKLNLGDMFPIWEKIYKGKLITEVEIPTNVDFVYQYVARSPADLPIVCCAVCRWPSGRTRGALGGYGDYPKMFFDGSTEEGLKVTAADSYSQADDQWASSNYRSEIAGLLAGRCLCLLND